MKLDHIEDNYVETLQKNEDLEFGIDKEDEWIIFQSFINYSNPIPSMIREIVSNAFDAHIEAGVNKNVEVEYIRPDYLTGTSASISIRDKGDGMSPEIIQTIYSKFGKSTKRDRDDAIGAFGLSY